ncbi:PepSY domain-containing protein [Thorsellia kenyensis]|uniref:PepSY domain-containing protein n=1 Tax=Thorsellia kenyensis TaxID=1549888 RepID=A0ABV6CC46_9GAMM
MKIQKTVSTPVATLNNKQSSRLSLRAIVLALSVVFLAGQSQMAMAKDRDGRGRNDHAIITEEVKGGQLLNVKKIAEIAEKEIPGHITDIDLDHDYNILAYEVKLIDTSGVRRKLEINAKTGEIISRY